MTYQEEILNKIDQSTIKLINKDKIITDIKQQVEDQITDDRNSFDIELNPADYGDTDYWSLNALTETVAKFVWIWCEQNHLVYSTHQHYGDRDDQTIYLSIDPWFNYRVGQGN